MISRVLAALLLAGCASPSGWYIWYRDPGTAWEQAPGRLTKADCEKTTAQIDSLRNKGHALPAQNVCLPVGERPPD